MKIFNLFILLALVFTFGGCIASPKATDTKTPVVQTKPKANEKTFEEEDAYIMFALRAEQLGEYDASSSIFNTLYERSEKKEYLYRSLQNDLSAKQNQKIIQRVNGETQGSLDDVFLVRIKIIALIQAGNLGEAEVLSTLLVAKTDSIDDHILLADIYVKEGKFEEAITHLNKVYPKDYNERIVDRIAVISFVNLQKVDEAIKVLESHSSVHGCSQLICSRLIRFYSAKNDIDGLLSSYLRLYQIDKSEQVSQKIAQIYTYKKEYIKLIDFLETSKSDNQTLLQLYISQKSYVKAYKLSEELYSETGDMNYLGQSAIYEYESNTQKDKTKMLKSVISKFEELVKVNDNTLYLNYYGYLLIDHKVDVKKGMVYVNKALSIAPDSAYYLDSLAWGYYRLGECKKAKNIIQKVRKLEGGDDKEVLLHEKAINRCQKNKRKGKR